MNHDTLSEWVRSFTANETLLQRARSDPACVGRFVKSLNFAVCQIGVDVRSIDRSSQQMVHGAMCQHLLASMSMGI